METPQELSCKLLLPEEQKNNSLWDFKSTSNKTKRHHCPEGNAWGPANKTPCWTAGRLRVGFPTCKNSSVKKHLLLFPASCVLRRAGRTAAAIPSSPRPLIILERHSSQVLRENWARMDFWAGIQPVTCLCGGGNSAWFSQLSKSLLGNLQTNTWEQRLSIPENVPKTEDKLNL